jgi:hypothetical protein
MKKSDINRLKKAVLHLKQVENNLNKVYDNLWNQDAEYIRFLDGHEKTTYILVFEMLNDIIKERRYIEGKIEVFEKL